MNDNIVLIGFMGSGKTTFGRWISRKHGYNFCDTDEYIEQKEHTTINDIFVAKGEEENSHAHLRKAFCRLAADFH